MTRWVSGCPDCNKDFTHTQIPPETGPFAWFAGKPEFPEGRLIATFLNCYHITAYKRHQLSYRRPRSILCPFGTIPGRVAYRVNFGVNSPLIVTELHKLGSLA